MSQAFFLPQLTHQVIDWQFSNFQVYADDAVAHTKTRYVPTEGNVERNFLSKIYVTKTYVTVHTEEKEGQKKILRHRSSSKNSYSIPIL